jgi:hypothetical protein
MEEQRGRSSRGSIESPLGRVSVSSSGQKQRPIINVEDPTDPVSPEGQYGQYVQEMPAEQYVHSSEPVQGRRRVQAQTREESMRAAADARYLAEEARRNRSEDKMESGAKRRVEILLGIGRGVKNVTIDNITFSLRTLKNGEWKDAIKAVAKAELAVEQAYEMRAQILSRSIFAIDNQPIEMVIGAERFEDQIDFIQNMDEAVVSHLYDVYNKLVEENKAKFNINTTEGAQEAVEAIKK